VEVDVMAWIEKRGSRYHLNLEFRGQHFSRSLRTSNRKEADGCRKRAEANLTEVERGRLHIPPGTDLILFLLSDGEANERPAFDKPTSLGELFKQYGTLPDGVKEANTRYTEEIHMRHLLRILGSPTLVASITAQVLQAYVDQRCQEGGRNDRPLSDATVRKEIGTFSSIWNRWALPRGIVQAPAPTKGLIYKKAKARPPFQTWQQIERQVQRGGLTEEQKETLWECMFLTLGEIDELLAYVRKEATRPLVYAMFVFAAHTGARRSEMLRSQIEDFDFVSGMVTIREKKRDRGKECTFRHVPMTPMLRQTMTDWFAIHPGGQLTVCEEPNVPMEPGSAHHHFRWTLDGSKWEPVHGWHTLRHSFCSNCAMKGLDQRIIDSWMGHQTEDMRRRYRHLFPDHQQHAMNQVFGKTA
jgi:integrase